MAALASNGNGSTEKVEKAMENMSVNEPAKALETVIGIDLGTTFSCVAVWDEAAGRPVVLTNSTGAKTMPSYVSFTDQARVVGQPAKSQAASNPANTVYDVKRIIGRSWNDQVYAPSLNFLLSSLVTVGQEASLLHGVRDSRTRAKVPVLAASWSSVRRIQAEG